MEKLKFLFVIFFLFTIFIKGQKTEFQLFGKTKCGDSIKLIELYSATKDSVDYVSWDTNPIVLPDTGVYFIRTADAEGDLIRINIYHKGLNKDTIVISSIFDIAYSPMFPHFSGWICCDEKCEGYQVDYYNNGNIRIEGTFRKGKAIGELKYYNLDGTLSTIRHFTKRGKYIRREDLP